MKVPEFPLTCYVCGIGSHKKFCTECGGPTQPTRKLNTCTICNIQVDGRFCTQCGGSLEEASATPPEQKPIQIAHQQDPTCLTCKVTVNGKFCILCGKAPEVCIVSITRTCDKCGVETQKPFCIDCGVGTSPLSKRISKKKSSKLAASGSVPPLQLSKLGSSETPTVTPMISPSRNTKRKTLDRKTPRCMQCKEAMVGHFCTSCGKKAKRKSPRGGPPQQRMCITCNIVAKGKFCVTCGPPQQRMCITCNIVAKGKFCVTCGKETQMAPSQVKKELQVKPTRYCQKCCRNCNGPFCVTCGTQTQTMCPKCSTVTATQAAFCVCCGHQFFRHSHQSSMVGSPSTAIEFRPQRQVAPMKIKMELPPKYGKKVDVWALGNVLYLLLTGVHAWMGPDQDQMFANIKKGDLLWKGAVHHRLTPESKDLISHMMDPNQHTRYSIDDCLKHPWLSRSVPRSLSNSALTGAKKAISTIQSQKKLRSKIQNLATQNNRAYGYFQPIQEEVLVAPLSISHDEHHVILPHTLSITETTSTTTLPVVELPRPTFEITPLTLSETVKEVTVPTPRFRRISGGADYHLLQDARRQVQSRQRILQVFLEEEVIVETPAFVLEMKQLEEEVVELEETLELVELEETLELKLN
eukprot:TRINITY_DN2860_c0_g1_i3.p1 TRINITY_DN2860_c0_g1~~TRINITY_DN2860_c0_g1_i3.p1  ORF type:complete len:636 (-),score=112.84 TRINITY_DN2860_c0_g1_i3:8-1915(-)